MSAEDEATAVALLVELIELHMEGGVSLLAERDDGNAAREIARRYVPGRRRSLAPTQESDQ